MLFQVVKLYERCLIACANYPEFWTRYVLCMEASGSMELANNALARATQVFVKVDLCLNIYIYMYLSLILLHFMRLFYGSICICSVDHMFFINWFLFDLQNAFYSSFLTTSTFCCGL